MSMRRRNIRTQTDQELAELEAIEQQQVLQGSLHSHHAEEPSSPLTAAHPPAMAPAHAGAVSRQSEGGEQRERTKRTRYIDEEDDEDDDEPSFEETYRRETYYLKRSNRPRLKKLLKKLRPRTKYEVMEEGLEYLFEKYGIE